MTLPATVRLAHRPKPFSLDRELLEFPVGSTVLEMVERAQPDLILRQHTVVRLGEVVIPADRWHCVRPKVGTVLQLATVPRSGQDVLKVVLVAAVVVAAIYAPYAIGPYAASLGAGTFGGAVVSATVPIGGSLTINALRPPAA